MSEADLDPSVDFDESGGVASRGARRRTASFGFDGISEATFGRLFDQLPDAVAVHDPEGPYLYVSEAYVDLFGWERDQLVGRDPYLLFHPDDIPDIQVTHTGILDSSGPTSMQYRVRCADGSYRWVETTNRVTSGGDIVAITRPIADRLSLLHALDNERVVAERLREVERERQAFLTAISHRARHPMTVLAGFTQLLQSGRVVDEATRQTIYDRLVANSQRLSELIEVVTTADELSRRANELRRRPVDLAGLVREVADDFWDLGHPDTPVSLHLPDQALVFGDRERLVVAVRALYHNAVKHTPLGTTVSIRVEQHPSGRLLVVEDEGPGVPDMLKSAVFDRLSHGETGHTHPDPGLGLGLYLVDQIARAHDGRAWVEDRNGGGASFHILLPTRRHERRAHKPGDSGAAMTQDGHPTDEAALCVRCGQPLDDLDRSAVYITEEGTTCATCQREELG